MVDSATWKQSVFCGEHRLFRKLTLIGAGDRGRTGTIGEDRGILSPVRLPIPPHRQKSEFSSENKLAPRVGLEPTAYRLTAGCSTIELPRNALYTAFSGKRYYTVALKPCQLKMRNGYL